MTIRFVNPDMASWYLAVPAAAAVWLIYVLYTYGSRRKAAVQPRFLPLSRRSTWTRDVAVLVLASATIALLVAALARPQILRERRDPEYERQDLILLLDRSVSMRARDIFPSRAQRSLAEVKTFLRRKPPSIERVGLVGFAGTSLVLSYLTSDLDNIMFYLDWIGDDPSILYGTDIGAALSSGLEVTRRDKRSTRKSFLLISDGEDTGGTVEQTVEEVKRARIRVHSIGIGSQVESLIPVGVVGGRDVFAKDDDGQLIMTRFEETTLKQVAAATGGLYARSTDGSELISALNTIGESEVRQTGWRISNEYRDVYGLLLAAAGVAAIGLVALL